MNSAHAKASKRRTLSTDTALWTRQRVFGVAGGPDEIVLTVEGNERAFSVGANLRRDASKALEALSLSADGRLETRNGSRLKRTDLGRYDQVVWGHLRSRGFVESFQDSYGCDGVRLTANGRQAVKDGLAERAYLLERCRRAARESEDDREEYLQNYEEE